MGTVYGWHSNSSNNNLHLYCTRDDLYFFLLLTVDGSQYYCKCILHGHDRQKSGFTNTGLPHSSAVCSGRHILSSPFYYCFKLSCGPLPYHCSEPSLTKLCGVPLLSQNHSHLSPSSCCPSSPASHLFPSSCSSSYGMLCCTIKLAPLCMAWGTRLARCILLLETSWKRIPWFLRTLRYNMWENCRWSALQSWSGGDTLPNTSRFSDGDAAVKEPSVTDKILRVRNWSRKITGTEV